jgi:hypothetical protein
LNREFTFSSLKESHHLALVAGATSFYIDIEEQPTRLRAADQPLLTEWTVSTTLQ